MTLVNSATRRRSWSHHLFLAALVTGCVAVGSVLEGCSVAVPAPTSPPSAPLVSTPSATGTFEVGAVDYDLGPRAFTRSWFHGFGGNGFPDPAIRAPMELTATVRYPIDPSGRSHPLVEIEHGLWYTCADGSVEPGLARAQQELAKLPAGAPVDGKKPKPDPRAAKWEAIIARDTAKITGWPCRKGVPPLPSYRGYDRLARELASHGIIAVSIGESGVNSGDVYAADRARAAVANEHLKLWARLGRTGGGPLAGRFVDVGTRRPAAVDFRGRVDLTRVGIVGHSRGGRGVMWQAADAHRGALPRGVKIGAVVTLAAAEITNIPRGDPRELQYLTSRIPVMAWTSTCDGAVTGSGDYLVRMRRRRHAELTSVEVRGANHDYLNTEWSPRSRQVGAYDDATHPRGRPDECRETVGGTAVRALDEQQEQAVETTYAAAFLRRSLRAETGFDGLLAGRRKPFAKVAEVRIESSPATAR